MDRKVLGIFLCVQAFLLITSINSDKDAMGTGVKGQPQQETTQGRYWRPGAHSGLANMVGPQIEPDPIVVTSSPVSGKPWPESDEMQPQSKTPN